MHCTIAAVAVRSSWCNVNISTPLIWRFILGSLISFYNFIPPAHRVCISE